MFLSSSLPKLILSSCFVFLATHKPTLFAQDSQSQSAPSKPIKQLILPGESFLVDQRPAFIMWPDESKRQTPQPWILYSPTLPRYPDQNEKWIHEQFLKAGVAIAGIDVGEAYGSPAGQRHFTSLFKELTENRGFAKRVCLLGRSRGGLWSSSWAISHPERVSGIAGIYPVFDLTTYPGLKRAAPAYGLTESELSESLNQHNPIAKIDKIAKAGIPVFIIHGSTDKVVPLKENSAELADRYKKLGREKLVNLIVVEGQGHNLWEGFFHSQPLVDFAIKRARAGAKNDFSFSPNQADLPVAPPENSIVLLSPTENLFLGRQGTEPNWPNENGVVTSTHGGSNMNHLVSKYHFRDADIHVEFMLPPKGSGNSGIYIHGNYELQILNTHGKDEITMNDMGALYGFKKALVNAARPPGEWQVYDIRYRAPRRNEEGNITKPGSVTAFLNGQKVQDETTFEEARSSFHPYRHGVTSYLKKVGKRQRLTMTGPIFLQDHNNAVKFRNVWLVPLDNQSRLYQAD